MSNNIKTVFLFILFCFSFYSIYSQTTKTEKLPLTTILKTIEQRFDIRFTFADALVKNIEIETPKKTLSYNETISYLKKASRLDFKIINSRFVAITNNEIKNITKSKNKPIQALDEVLLTSILTSGITKNKTGEIVLKPKKFGILPGLIEPDVLQSIQALPGILSVDESVSNLNIRGGTHDQNLILWEGIKMYQSGHFFGLISAFNPYLTKKVIVSKNGTSALYGNAVSSTIDMRLDTELNKENTSEIGLNLIEANAFTKQKLTNNIELQIAARRALTDAVKTPTYRQYFDRVFQDSDINNTINSQATTTNERFYFYDVSAKLLYDISSKDKLRLSFTNLYNALDYIEKPSEINSNSNLNSGINQQSIASSLNYNRQWSNFISTNLQVQTSNYTLDAINFNTNNNQKLVQQNKVQDNAFTIALKLDFSERLQWINGYEFTDVGITNLEDVSNPSFRSKIKRILTTHATFSEFSYSSLNQTTHLKVGARSNYFKFFDLLLVEPRLSFNQQFLKYFKVEFLGEFKSQTTSQIIDRQNDFLGIEKRRWQLANNTTLPIIESQQASIGLHYNKNKLLINAEAFIKNVEGITTRSQGFQNQYQNINAIGNYKTMGIDFLINKQFNSLSTWLSYSFCDNNYTFLTLNNGQAFANNVDITHALSFASTYTLKDLKLALGFNWHSGKPFTTPNVTTPVFDNAINYNVPNAANLSDYFRTDFSGIYSFNLTNKTRAKVGLSIWNILNRKNTLNSYYILNDDDSIIKIDNKSLGITPNLSFRVGF